MGQLDEREAARLADCVARAHGFTPQQREAYLRGVLAAMARGDPLLHHAGMAEAKVAGWLRPL